MKLFGGFRIVKLVSVTVFWVCYQHSYATFRTNTTFSGDEGGVNSALKAFKLAQGDTNAETIVACIEKFKSYPNSSSELINLIARRLRENDPLYQGRGPKEVERLRGYMLASLSKIGINERVIPILKAELLYGYHPYMVAAAARGAGKVQGDAQAAFVPLLIKYLDERYKDDYVDLDTYGYSWPLKKLTSARFEAIEALSKIGASAPQLAVPALKEIAEAEKGRFFSSDHLLILKAKSAIEKITSGNGLQPTILGSNVAVCCTNPLSVNQNGFSAGDSRQGRQIRNFKAIDQNGRVFELKNIVGKPFLFTFFYTRCDNPNKCSSTVQNIAALKQILVKEGLSDQVTLIAITFDPEFDGPAALRSYGEGRGAVFDEHFKFISINSKLYPGLIKDLGVLVNYGKGMVNHHGNQWYIFDRKAQLAKIYENTALKTEDLVVDIRQLLSRNLNAYSGIQINK
ncbi:SCO family protein [Desertivirga xinjiangensis]|uniref:SCO family protein n=1 Tax=Desertivirga xinjiangensis TaxID=539206 RepID=UPI00210E0438|nr:SCO family protein [Pedobacter xinjiangensis]